MDNSKKSCVCLGELEKKEDCIVVTILDDSNFKMEFGRAFSHMATHILENFEWLSCKQEKGILSNSKKRIFYASLDPEKNRMDQVKLKKLCGYLKSDKIYYRFEETQELQRDWISHAMKNVQILWLQRKWDISYLLTNLGMSMRLEFFRMDGMRQHLL